jgi:REP element-mobilizing transposase RayT
MKGPPIYLQKEQAAAVLEQFRATATYRGWALLAVSIMTNHWHLVVGVPEGYAAERVLADFKAYASRVLNRQYGRPPSGTWWTTKGSTRRLNDQQAVDQTIHYVLHRQNKPLVVWSAFADRLQRELES